jgi:hypothetical protein
MITFLAILMLQTLVAACLGMAAKLHIGAFLVSTECLKSPKRATRYYYRYVLFNFHYLISLLCMPVLIAPFTDQIKAHPEHRDLFIWLYLAACLLPASLLFYLNWRSIVWHDEIKLAARESAKRYWR